MGDDRNDRASMRAREPLPGAYCCKPDKGVGMTVRFALVGVAAAAMLAGCGSTPVAAPVTSVVTSVATSAVTATVVQSTTESVTETVPGPTETIAGPNVTVLKTVTKPAPPRVTVTKTDVREVVKTMSATVTAEPPAPAGSFSDGTYLVGTQVQPGTYQASNANPGASDLCYWETTTKAGDIIDNGVNNGVMNVPGDAFAVRVAGCGTWHSVG